MQVGQELPAPLSFDATGAWLAEATRDLSPNCDERPEGVQIDLLVLHAISLPPGRFGTPYVRALFLNQLDPTADPYFSNIAHLRVSAHVVIDRVGRLTQYVPFTLRAWHAGVSSFEGREACNDFSIGIELEGADDTPFAAPQYAMAVRLVGALMRQWPRITPQRVVRHCDIAPGRKTDPGPAFDWPWFRTRIGRPFTTDNVTPVPNSAGRSW